MKTIQAIPITKTNFLQYGFLANIAEQSDEYSIGEPPCVFYRDMAVIPVKDCTPPAFGRKQTTIGIK